MKLFLAFALLYQDGTTAFTPSRPVAMTNIQPREFPALAMGDSDDEYDDWYADFDPSKFETYGQDSETFSSRRDSDHDYTRDTTYDQSNVDLDEVNYLIAERLTMRKTGRYDEADAIRDELLKKHGVMVRDKERVWRSGASANGSGRRFATGQNQNSRGNGRFKQKDFGPNGHDYNMAQNAGPIDSPLKEEEIHALIAERLQCKLKRDYNTADAIQEELMEAGVVLLDKKKEWRADGAGWDEFAPRRYNQSPHSMPVEDAEEIQAMVDERAKAKSDRIYNKADALRNELLDQFDVVVDDRLFEWSVGGDFGVVKTNKSDEFVPFKQVPGSQSVDDHDEIQALVEERDAARADRDFATADQIREQLKDRNIFIDDRKREWSVGRSGNDMDGSYRRRGGGDLSEEDEQEIMDLLQKRSEHKRNRKFKSADSIRDRLQQEFNIQIDDRSREWHVVTNNYVMGPSSVPVDDDIRDHIQELVDQRAVAKLQKDYATADSIREVLMERYVVTIDDRTKEWAKLDERNDGTRNEDTNTAVEDVEISLDSFDDSLAEEEDTGVETTMDTADSGSEDDQSPTTSEEELEKLTVPELKERLRAAQLPVSGKKAELIERLVES